MWCPGKKFVKVEEKKEKTVYDDEFEKLLAEAEGIGDAEITDGDIDALAGLWTELISCYCMITWLMLFFVMLQMYFEREWF